MEEAGEKKALSGPATIAIILAAVLLIGFLGWRVMNSGERGPDGQDYSTRAMPPANRQQPAGPNVGGGPGGR